jgi:hypothetical protein
VRCVGGDNADKPRGRKKEKEGEKTKWWSRGGSQVGGKKKKKNPPLILSFSTNKWPCFGLLINWLIFEFLMYKWVVNK